VFLVIEINVLIASASALKIEKDLGSRISLFSPGMTTAHPTLSYVFNPAVFIWAQRLHQILTLELKFIQLYFVNNKIDIEEMHSIFVYLYFF
jgi:hypothetical protein